ncbi:putative O-methyltransferase [Aspergillus ellipticus CBS 707.79]|uniref:Putative O-methyltransferase n=1 Tax=Aspergillus ellipticus CBS 707.79 TaxID=1448320 RepID=A0A319E934_9EURO|nr:putative O-methyltransferase [Aspergillus ellipticus CBS 707.79]
MSSSSDTPESIVEHAYNHITEWYLEWVQTQKSPRQRYTQLLLDHLPQPQEAPRSILDLGCGPGIPTLQTLLTAGFRVTANDISPSQLALARTRCPTATFLPGDMTTLTFAPHTFDAAVSFYTLFHLPRAKLQPMLAGIYDWLKPGGIFAFNLATLDEEEIHGEFLGYGMFWSSFGVERNRGVLAEVGFEVLREEVLKAGEGGGERGANGEGGLEEGDPDFEAEFMWVLVRKPGVE